MKVLTVFGTRPEAIKMAPVIKHMRQHPSIVSKVVVTAQHRQMLDPFLKLFSISPDYDLNIMVAKQRLDYITSAVLTQLSPIIEQEKPDFVLVQGDTTTAMATALAAFYQHVRVGHIEAGLRTHDKNSPFPEEVNRRVIDHVSDLFFVHTAQAQQNLIHEGIRQGQIELTGNTVIDALLEVASSPTSGLPRVLENIPFDSKKIILVTAHRRENLGKPLANICEALKRLAHEYKDEVAIVYPVHLNPQVRLAVSDLLHDQPNIYLLEPLEYADFVYLMKKSYLILSDSGGLQEEAPSLHKPLLVLRESTERPEGIEAHATKLVGTDVERIVEAVSLLMEDAREYQKMSQVPNPYGDGLASQRIVARMLHETHGQ